MSYLTWVLKGEWEFIQQRWETEGDELEKTITIQIVEFLGCLVVIPNDN